MDEYRNIESTNLEKDRNWPYNDIYSSLHPFLNANEGQ